MIQIKIAWILLYVSLKNSQVYKWLNRVLEFLKSFHYNLRQGWCQKIIIVNVWEEGGENKINLKIIQVYFWNFGIQCWKLVNVSI